MALAAALCAGAGGALAQDFPNKPVRLILPYSPGGIVDYVGRTLAQYAGDVLGQPMIVENRPGAGGITGTDSVARSAADGYTIVLMDPAIVINPTLQPSMPYDLFKQLRPCRSSRSSPLVVVVAPRPAGEDASRTSSPTARPIPASSISPPPASAPRRISPASCSSSAPASTPRTCPTRASASPIRT